MSRYEDGHPPRGRGVDYYTFSGGVAAPPAYSHHPEPGHTTYDGKPQARLTYDPQDAYYPSGSALVRRHGSESHSRQRSPSPPYIDSSRDGRRRRDRRHGRDSSDRYYSGGDDDDNEDDDDRVRSPIGKAKRFVDNTFTDSATGLGVGVLGALVGGLAAREAIDFTSNRQRRNGDDDYDDAEHKRNQLIGAVVGAAVGALGANAVEKRIEDRRARDELKQERWERKWRRPEGADPEVLEKLEVVAARPRSRGHSRDRGDRDAWDGDGDGYDDGYGGRRSGRSRSRRRGFEREVDPAARSWKNVDDWRRTLTPPSPS